MTKFWEEREGEQSATRLVFLWVTLYATVLSAFVWFQTKDWVASSTVFGTIFSLGAGTKLIQKPQEKE